MGNRGNAKDVKGFGVTQSSCGRIKLVMSESSREVKYSSRNCDEQNTDWSLECVSWQLKGTKAWEWVRACRREKVPRAWPQRKFGFTKSKVEEIRIRQYSKSR